MVRLPKGNFTCSGLKEVPITLGYTTMNALPRTGLRKHEAHLMADHIGYVQQGEYCASQHSRAQQTERLV